MRIEFVLNSIKDTSMIYLSEEITDKDLGVGTHIEYKGTEYCERIINLVTTKHSEIKEQAYKGQTERIANEEYEIITASTKYRILFTIDSNDDKKATQLMVSISTDSTEGYDLFLERLKISIKEALIKEWETCTWIVDEQSEFLGAKLYPKIFKTENKIRAFINKVLTYQFGVHWSELIGLEDIVKNHDKNKVSFRRDVPEFNNINDIFISATLESLAKVMLKANIYDTAITITESDAMRLHKQLADKNIDSIFSIIRDARKPKLNLWTDIFSKYFEVDEPQKMVTDFIKNRNHVAHNKLLTKNAYDKMLGNIDETEKIFDKADAKFLDEEPSDELYMTWQAEQEQAEQEEEYIFGRIKDETGIEIRDADEVFDIFDELINDFHAEMDDGEYFNYSVEISSLLAFENSAEKQIVFSVESKVDHAFDFNVCVDFNINEGMDEDSYMHIWAEKLDGTKFLEAHASYHNGEACEDNFEGYYIPVSESSVYDEDFREFIVDLKTYIKDEMNAIKTIVDTLSHLAVKDGGNAPVADFPCWNCGQEYLSLDSDIYPYGHCINCGEKTELKECIRCYSIYPADEGTADLCDYCYEKIEKE